MHDESSARVVVNEKEYDLSSFGELAKVHLQNIQAIDGEIADIQRRLSVMEIAHASLTRRLLDMLPKEAVPPKEGEDSVVVNGVAHAWSSLSTDIHEIAVGVTVAKKECDQLRNQLKLAHIARQALATEVRRHVAESVSDNASLSTRVN